ncbi:hypothetical protein BRD18_02100 [Halobacteriales archaeon SW_7_71_33]|nr:MAG: hypothetical protein BRD18_02100 [Halobacteriales archaeon SW_7_71_33]
MRSRPLSCTRTPPSGPSRRNGTSTATTPEPPHSTSPAAVAAAEVGDRPAGPALPVLGGVTDGE